MVQRFNGDIYTQDGFEFVGDMPRSIMHNEQLMIVVFDVKRIEQQQEDPLAELKAQYQRDVETCRDIDGLEAWELWQFDFIYGVNWTTFDREFIFNLPKKYKYRRHPHADNIIAFHKCSDEDKKRWEFFDIDENEFARCLEQPMWKDSIEYRLPPMPFYIGKHEVPPPVTEPLEDEQAYWHFDTNAVWFCKWSNDDVDENRLEKRTIRLTKEDAKKCFEALQETLKGN